MNEKGFMPDLPISEQIVEQRKVIKFWIDHCAALEKERDKWKRLFIQGYESDATSDEAMWAYRNETGKA